MLGEELLRPDGILRHAFGAFVHLREGGVSIELITFTLLHGFQGGSCWIPGSWMCRGRPTHLWSPYPPGIPYFPWSYKWAALLGRRWRIRPRNPIRAQAVTTKSGGIWWAP